MAIHYPALYRPHWPVLLPAVSNTYTNTWAALRAAPSRSLPTPYTLNDLNFLSSSSRFFSIGDCLYSFGLLVGKDGELPAPDMVTDRTLHDARVMADSGGYQAAVGDLDIGMGRWVPSLVEFVNTYCDWSPIADLPTAATDNPKFAAHLKRLVDHGGYDPQVMAPSECRTLDELMAENGLGVEFNTCLWYTKYNGIRNTTRNAWSELRTGTGGPNGSM